MRPRKAIWIPAEALIAAAARGELNESLARQLYRHGPEVVTLALLAAGKRIAELEKRCGQQQASPSTPSAMVPVYAKPNASKRRKRPGAQRGHPGARRGQPARIDRRVEHRLKCCPHCHGPVQRCNRKRTRIIEDIPDPIIPVITEHTIHRDYCPACKKHVEPVVPEALPGATLGHHTVGLTGWLHYGLGVTLNRSWTSWAITCTPGSRRAA